MIELIAAEGNKIKVAGTTELELQLPGGGWARSTALVCPKLSHEMLLSWVSQKKIQMLHRGWPFKTVHEYNDYSTACSIQPPVTPKGLRPPEPKVEPTSPVWPPLHFPKRLRELCLEFQDVLVEELTPDQKMACPPMEVDIAPGTKPFYARRPRRFPLHWAEKIKKKPKNW